MSLDKPLDEFTANEAVLFSIGTLVFLLAVPRIFGYIALAIAG